METEAVTDIIRISARPTAEEIVQRRWVKPSRREKRAQYLIGFLFAAFVLGGLYLAYIHWGF